jgi:hypothetical protein
MLTGDKITFFREKNLMICEPGATLRIYPEKGVSKENLLGDKKGGRK